MQIRSFVLDSYLDRSRIQSVHPVSGGLSHSQVWQVTSNDQVYAIKAWPMADHTADRLAAVHRYLEFVSCQLPFIPRIRKTKSGQSLLPCEGYLWECSTWLPGQARDASSITLVEGQSAITAIAQMHQLSAGYHSRQGVSPSVSSRIELLQHYKQQWELMQHSAHAASPEMKPLALSTLSSFANSQQLLIEQLKHLTQPLPLNWIVRDLHAEHLLFVDQQVTGIIDFGAARVDESMIDLVRLLSSLWPTDVQARHKLLEQYQQIMLKTELIARFRTLDQASTLLSAMQWLQWLLVERREFAVESPRLMDRWRGLVVRLEQDQW